MKVKVFQGEEFLHEVDDAEEEIEVRLKRPLGDASVRFEPALRKRASTSVVLREPARSTMTRAQLEWRLIYALVVAGKSARFANAAVARLQRVIPRGCLRIPIAFLGSGENPGAFLRAARTGNYGKLERACRALREAGLNLGAVGPAELERIPGVGPKTSRLFVTWTRPTERYAVLDRHVLRWMAERGHQVPKTTPASGRAYGALEAIYLREAEAAGRTPRGLDLEVWRAAATADNVVEDVE